MKTKKFVKDLKKGDKLSGSGCLVVTAPSAGINTPTGKVDLEVEYPNGRTKFQTWNKNTTVTVES
jgi:hypothetical protein